MDQSKHLLKQISEDSSVPRNISEDSSVPRNIRRAANEAIAVLENDGDSPAVRAQNAISIIDEPSQDPNCPNHARTKIWHVSFGNDKGKNKGNLFSVSDTNPVTESLRDSTAYSRCS
jgi:uncharacterized protein (UPF0147 family)